MSERKIKVFHVLTDKNIGGAGRWLLYYLKYYDREKFDLWVILPEGSALYPAVTAMGAAAIPLEEMEDSSYDKKAKKALFRLFSEEKPDIVHTHASLSARMAARAAGVPEIFNTKHCMEGAPGSIIKKIFRREINRRYSTTIIAVSKAVKRSMVAGGTSPDNIVVIYNGIDPVSPLSGEEKARVIEEYGGDSHKKSVGIIARLEEVKDHNTFLLAARDICEKRKDVQFFVIGDGSLMNSLREKAAELGIARNVIFTGFVKNVEEIGAALDISVITSKEEALCLSLIETMSAGVPAVGTNCGGVGEVIRHGENGYLAPVGDHQAIAERILELLEDEEKYNAMSKRGRLLARERFSAAKMAARLEQLYLEEKK